MSEQMKTTTDLMLMSSSNLADLFDQFVRYLDRTPKTTATYLKNLKQFAIWLADENITEPDTQTVKDYRDHLLAAGYKSTTVAAYTRSVRQFFRWTAAMGIYPDIAGGVNLPKVDRTTHKKDALSAAEVYAVEQSIQDRAIEKVSAASDAVKDTSGRMQRASEQGKRDLAMFLLATRLGLRTVELSRANIKDLETKGDQVWLYVWRKGHAEADRKKPVPGPVADALMDYLASRTDNHTGDSPLFVSTGNRSGGKRIATTTVSTILKRTMVDAGYDSPRLTAHSLRHTAGTAAMKVTGGNIYDTQTFMDHASPATTEIYLHMVNDERQADITDKLDQYFRTAGASVCGG